MPPPDPHNITDQPLARAVLAKLAETHGEDDPLGSFARTVLAGEADLRTAANFPWHSEALEQAFVEAKTAQERLSPEEREAFEREAQRLRNASDAELAGPVTEQWLGGGNDQEQR